ncbi:sugar ABC transporter permease, partial [Listeria monocytogenes]|nr:sugar ABC transporter permease [Listeria monocytogenes]
TDLLVTWLYKLTVEAADYNLASVIGIVTFILSAAFSLFAYTRTNSYKEGSN